MALVNSGFHTQKGFSENFLKLGLEPSNFRQACPRRKKFKELVLGTSKLFSCHWRQTLNLPGRPNVSDRFLDRGVMMMKLQFLFMKLPNCTAGRHFYWELNTVLVL